MFINVRLQNNRDVYEIIAMLPNYCFVVMVSLVWHVTWEIAVVLLITRHQNYVILAVFSKST